MGSRRPLKCPIAIGFNKTFAHRLHGRINPGEVFPDLSKYACWPDYTSFLIAHPELARRVMEYFSEAQEGDPGFAAIKLHSHGEKIFSLKWAEEIVLRRPTRPNLQVYLSRLFTYSVDGKDVEVPPAATIWRAVQRQEGRWCAGTAISAMELLAWRAASWARRDRSFPKVLDAHQAHRIPRAADAVIALLRSPGAGLRGEGLVNEVAEAATIFLHSADENWPLTTRAVLRAASRILQVAGAGRRK